MRCISNDVLFANIIHISILRYGKYIDPVMFVIIKLFPYQTFLCPPTYELPPNYYY